MRLPALVLAALLVAGCSESTQTAKNAADSVADVAEEAMRAAEDKSIEAETTVAEAATPIALDLREAVESIRTEPLPPPAPNGRGELDRAAVELVVRWEVGNPAQFDRKYQGVICPGGASGPTIGIGYDLGTQTQREIRAAWGWHPAVDRLVTASGQVGPGKCAAWRAEHRDIRVTYADAFRVFQEREWPRYMAMAARAYRNGWENLSPAHQYGLGSNGYNRGFSFLGAKRRELVVIRDTCVPQGLAPCTADQLRASCRVWEGTPIYNGICARRHDEARFVVRQ